MIIQVARCKRKSPLRFVVMTVFYDILYLLRPAYCNPRLIDFHRLCRTPLISTRLLSFYSVPEIIGLLTSSYVFCTFVPFSNVFQKLNYLTTINIVFLHSIHYSVLTKSSQMCIPNFRLRLKMDPFTNLNVWFVIVHGVQNSPCYYMIFNQISL